ncbi:phosphatase [Enterococcus faecalis]|uniref:macro domain-containing protein n=1 Tax=Enterococcus faecalis TaxID=1351 RepID=UPI000A19E11F|nr:macro domain-containing protein [Enterococcus faecalis]EGO8127785.1 macro domain-containing protein [Enterococcus faecalis]EGO8156694.1 macro domain-containing protein [Enterococcus faecalis]EGO8375399.1 phosphatase [Enterococcus faecalis]EHB6445939.1 macro domain-containing protein [Enterococcus faecalis]EHU9656857.1 macro domain-containing protein [Enterococcus faecalis]
MLVYVEQDIFQSPAQVIVNTVNTVGVMGKGIAKRFKDVYPEMYREYRDFCERGFLEVGKLWIYKTENKWILNFPTKKHWRNPSKIEYIEAGLKKFVETYEERGITSISFPQLGCGNGGLNWELQVKPLMEKYLRALPIDIFIHIRTESNSGAEHMNVTETLKWLRKSPRNLSVTQLLDDMRESIEANNYVLDKHGNWVINIFGEEEDNLNFILENDGYTITITYENLYDMWIKLRDYGYLISYDLPVEFSQNNDDSIVFMFLEQLSYIESISIINISGSQTVGVTINKYNLPDFTYDTSGGVING